jgi:hypothetical protein
MTPHQTVTGLADVTAGAVAFGALAGYLPSIAAGMTVIYYTVKFCVWLAKKLG